MQKILITGGAGFIGSNTADYFLKKGDHVIILDNLSRRGVDKNLEWLKSNHGNSDKFQFIKGDVRKQEDLVNVVKDADIIFHFASQVAVTTSVEDPRTDYDINLTGAFNLLEAARKSGNNPIIVFTSTNKVYGGLENLEVIEKDGKYIFKDLPLGVSENQNLDFHSPYGCSKGSADQYMRDYARIYGMRTIVFRMSCQFGIMQFGNEDQGWIAHFVISAVKNKPLNIYGNGKQVRDVLYIDDLINGFESAIKNIDKTAGDIYNIGGGAENTLNLVELIDILEKKLNKKIPLSYSGTRPGDQLVYISDIRKAYNQFGWKPKVSPEQGIEKLLKWVMENPENF